MWLVLFTIIYFEAVHLPIQRQTNCFLKLTLDKSSLKITQMVNFLTADFKCSLTITNRSRKNCGKSCCN